MDAENFCADRVRTIGLKTLGQALLMLDIAVGLVTEAVEVGDRP